MLASLALLGGVTIAGTGFASWYFQDSVNAATADVNVYVTNKHTAGATLSQTAPGQLQLDDPQFGAGLQWCENNAVFTTYQATVTPDSNMASEGKAGYTMDFKLTITLPSTLLTYVVYNAADVNKLSTSDTIAGTATSDVSSATATTTAVTYELKGLALETQTISLTLTDLVNYTTAVVTTAGKTGERATTFTEDSYDAMSTALSGQKITFVAELSFNTTASA